MEETVRISAMIVTSSLGSGGRQESVKLNSQKTNWSKILFDVLEWEVRGDMETRQIEVTWWKWRVIFEG